jgi:serine/arginine repetitive matrix protein 2
MTERTFRSPSPGRGSPADANAPPVPSVPKTIPQTGAGHRRASSLEPSYRGGSPAPRGGGRGVSLDRGSGPTTGGRGQRVASNLSQVVEDDQDAAQRSSVNFSRPMSPASAAKSGWFGGPVVNQDAVQRMTSTSRPKTSSAVASADLRSVQQAVQSAADRPVQTHQIARGAQGSRLSSGSMRAKPSGTAVESRSYLQQATRHAPGPVDPKSPDAVFDPSTRTFVHKQDAMARHRELHEEPEQPARHYVAQHVEEHYPPPVAQQRPRTPSPVRQPVRREESPAVQRREEVALPRLDTTSARIRRPEDPPTGIPSHDLQAKDALRRTESADYADADMQPLEQANTGRKLEDTVQPTPIDVMVSPKFAANQDSSYPRLSTSIVPPTTNNLVERGNGSVRTTHDRGQSMSPPRNAHFAPVAVELAGIKHQPPPRSISPAKSALKSSPSVSRRGTSPVSQNGRLLSRGTSSEVSDTTSEGGSKHKPRSIRVSFEEAPVIAGTSAYADAETPTTPAGLGASKWSPKTEKENEFEDFMKPRPALPSFGSIRDRERRSTQDEVPEKVTETVSSTPMSASMGSIGEPLHTSNDHALAGIVAQDYAQKRTSMNDPLPPEVTTVEGTGYVSDSSDEADRTTGLQKHGAVDDSSQILPVPEPKSLTAPQEGKLSTPASLKEQSVEIPEIALLPATPSPIEGPEPKFQSMIIPGGWDEEVLEAEDRNVDLSGATTTLPQPASTISTSQHPTNLHDLVTRDDDYSDDNSSVYSDAYEDLSDAEGGFASIDAVVDSPVASSPTGLMFSRYADKNIAEPTGSGLRNETTVNDIPEPTMTSTQDWDATKQHWSGLNEARKQPHMDNVSGAEPLQSDNVVARVMAAPVKEDHVVSERKTEPQTTPVKSMPSTLQPQTTQSTSKPLKSALKKTAVAQPAPAVQAQPQIRKTMREQAARDDRTTEPQMRTTMRGPTGRDARSSEPQMRKSMRVGTQPPPREPTQMRTSMRGSNSATTGSMGLAASRHSMPPVEQKPPRAALQKKHIPAGAVAAKSRPQSMPAVNTRSAASVPTYDSDSDASASSFQRARGRRSGNQNSRYTMRASMRQDTAPTMRTAAPAPKQVRAISPPGSPTPALRKSMRPSSPTPDPPKSSKFSIRSLSPMGRFRSSKPIEAAPPLPTQTRKVSGFGKQPQPKAKAPVAERAKPAFMSRFADSSDEDDDGRPSRFQSRFADSDEDESGDYTLPPGLAPVRGIPKKAGEEDGDSTDLEEEVDDAPASATAANKEMSSGPQVNGASQIQTNGNANGQGAALATGSLRDSKHAPLPAFEGGGKSKTKRGFFGLGKKKTAVPLTSTSTSAPQAVAAPTDATQASTMPPAEIPLPPQQRNRDQGLPLTPIDEDKDFGSPVQTSPQTKKLPKLQRRSTPEWPLPHNNIPVPPIPADARPMSSDGIAPRRPRFQMRQSSQMSNVTTATAPIGGVAERSVSYGRGGKKKKFQGLRRVFGLND